MLLISDTTLSLMWQLSITPQFWDVMKS